MISVIETTAGKGSAPIYQLKVVLLGSEPPVWRRLQVPGDAKLDWLHAVLQIAIGWTNSHLHAFQAGENRYSDTRHHFAECEGDPEIREARKFTLRQIHHARGDDRAHQRQLQKASHHDGRPD